MAMSSLFAPGSLLIWLPGLFFIVALVYASIALDKGRASRPVKLLPLGLFVLAAVVACLVPWQEMNKAVDFANMHESHTGPALASYADIPYAAKDAYFRTALPLDQQHSSVAASGGDLFDFSEPDSSAAPAQTAADAAANNATASEMPVYQPQRGTAWLLLMLFLLCGGVFYLQGLRRFHPPRRV